VDIHLHFLEHHMHRHKKMMLRMVQLDYYLNHNIQSNLLLLLEQGLGQEQVLVQGQVLVQEQVLVQGLQVRQVRQVEVRQVTVLQEQGLLG
jgi:hypothetical protein